MKVMSSGDKLEKAVLLGLAARKTEVLHLDLFLIGLLHRDSRSRSQESFKGVRQSAANGVVLPRVDAQMRNALRLLSFE